MGNTTVKCPNGHSSVEGHRFCGECGVSLVGVCPAGHPNPDGKRYCGECGAQLPVPSEPLPPIARDAPPTFESMPAQPEKEVNGLSSRIDGALASGSSRLVGRWARLPKWGKLAVAVGVVAAVIIIATSGGRDKASYDYGYQIGTWPLTQSVARGSSKEDACKGNLKVMLDLPTGKKYDRGDAMEGCIDALSGHPLGPG